MRSGRYSNIGTAWAVAIALVLAFAIWPAIAEAQSEVSLGFVIAGVTRNATGDVRSVRVTTSTENANGVSFEFHGTSVGSV